MWVWCVLGGIPCIYVPCGDVATNCFCVAGTGRVVVVVLAGPSGRHVACPRVSVVHVHGSASALCKAPMDGWGVRVTCATASKRKA